MQVRAKVPFALDFAFLPVPSSAEAAEQGALIGDVLSATLAKHRQRFDERCAPCASQLFCASDTVVLLPGGV